MRKKLLTSLLLCTVLTLLFSTLVSAATNAGKSLETAVVISETGKQYEWTITNKLWSDDGMPLGLFDDMYFTMTPAETAVYTILGTPQYDCYFELYVMDANMDLINLDIQGYEVLEDSGAYSFLIQTELNANQTYYIKLGAMESGAGTLTVTGGKLQASNVDQPVVKPVISTIVGVEGYSINGEQKPMPACYYKGSDTMMPIRMLQDFGVTLAWDDATQTATMGFGSTNIELTIGSTDAVINGTKTAIIGASGSPVAPEVEAGRTMIPLRFVSQHLGFKVQWDPSNLITISE